MIIKKKKKGEGFYIVEAEEQKDKYALTLRPTKITVEIGGAFLVEESIFVTMDELIKSFYFTQHLKANSKMLEQIEKRQIY